MTTTTTANFEFGSDSDSSSSSSSEDGVYEEIDPHLYNLEHLSGMQFHVDDDSDENGEEFEVDFDAEDEEEKHVSDQERKNVINGIHSFKFEERKEPDNCMVCHDILKQGKMVKRLDCSHIFHSTCINKWLKQKLCCPLCKVRVR